MRIYSLKDAYEMIFCKLADMTPEKTLRYQNVYHKLSDFEKSAPKPRRQPGADGNRASAA